MPEKLKRIFEKEYELKGYTKEEADKIFYGHQSNLKKKEKNKLK